MSMFDKLTRFFGLLPLHDFDIPDEPSARSELRALNCVDSSPRNGSPGVDGPTAPATLPGAVGHPDEWPIDWDQVRDDIASIRALPDALAALSCADRNTIVTQMTVIVEAATKVVALMDRIEEPASVTDINSRR